MPVGGEGRQDLLRITRTAQGYEREQLGAVSFVPLQSGTVTAE
jgi:protein-L-isoaspartate O-methyltransferase